MSSASRERPFATRFGGALLLSLLVPVWASGQDTVAPLGIVSGVDVLGDLSESWRWRYFDRRDGLSSSNVSSLFQDRDDYIYAATDVGLCRYDFHRWEVIENEEPFDTGAIVRFVESQGRVYCATASTLWMTEGGGPLRRVFPSREAAGPGRGGRLFVASGPLGEIFVVYQEPRGGKKHYQVRGRTCEELQPVVRLLEGRVLDYQIDQQGVHWLATSEGIQQRSPQERRWRKLTPDDLDLPFVDAVCPRLIAFDKPVETEADGSGGVRVRSKRRVLWALFHPRGRAERWIVARFKDQVWTHLRRRIDVVSNVAVEDVLNDRAGNHFATCEDGSLLVLPAGSRGWLPVNDPDKGDAKLLHGGIIDSAGHLWFRLRSGGVATFDGESRRWEVLPSIAGRKFPSVLTLCEAMDGDVWAGTSNGVLRYRAVTPSAADVAFGEAPDVRWELDTQRESINDRPLGRVTGLAEDGQGNIWISSADDFSGCFFFDGSNWVAQRPKGLGDAPVRRIATESDRLRGLWFLPEQEGQRDGPVVYRRSALTGYAIEAVPVKGYSGRGSFNDLVRVSENTLWIASDDGLLRCRLDDDEIEVERRYSRDDGLTGGRIWAVGQGPDGSIWACYWSSGQGLTRIEGETITSYDVADGLPSSGVFSIVADRNDLWFGTEAGVARFDGECWYGFPVASESRRTSGVYPVVPSQRNGLRRSLLLGTLVHGVYRLTLDDRDRPEFVAVDFPEETRSSRSARFQWEARDYKNRTPVAELLFRYRLDGGAWSPFSRQREALFAELDQGMHSFEVEVRDLDGNRNREKVVHRFVVGAVRSSWPFYVVGGIAGMAFLLAFAEIARRRLRERAEKLQRYRGLFQSNPVAVFLLDTELQIVDYNGAARELIGLEAIDPDDLLGRPFAVISAFGSSRVTGFLRVCRGQAGSETLQRTTVTAEGRDGGERVLELTCYPDHGPGKRRGVDIRDASTGSASDAVRLVVHVEDCSRERLSRSLVKREDRLRGIRDLASRVSESIASLTSALEEACAGQGDSGNGSSAELARVESRLKEAKKMLRVLRGIAALDTVRAVAAEVDLEDVIESLLATGVDGKTREVAAAGAVGVRVDCRFQLGLWSVAAEETEIAEAMREVLANAFEAMPAEGQLVVRASNLRVEDDPGVLTEGSYVEVSVRDAGHGIDPSQLESIFDPFYSTKPRDRAMGVGLSLAYSIVRRWGGDIRVLSRPSAGTTVRVLLPAKRGA